MPIVLKAVVDTSKMELTDDGSTADKVLFHLKCDQSTTLLPVYGIIVKTGWIVVMHMIIFGDDKGDIGMIRSENTEWADSDAHHHMALAIASVVEQMDQKGYKLLSDNGLEEGEDAIARLVFRQRPQPTR